MTTSKMTEDEFIANQVGQAAAPPPPDEHVRQVEQVWSLRDTAVRLDAVVHPPERPALNAIRNRSLARSQARLVASELKSAHVPEPYRELRIQAWHAAREAQLLPGGAEYPYPAAHEAQRLADDLVLALFGSANALAALCDEAVWDTAMTRRATIRNMVEFLVGEYADARRELRRQLGETLDRFDSTNSEIDGWVDAAVTEALRA